MYGKLVNGILITAPKILTIGKQVYYQPSEKIYKSQGYKKIEDTPYPEVSDEDFKYYTERYEEKGDVITKVWVEEVIDQ